MASSIQNLRNIAIIAHVDHGKTTLVDQLLRQSGTLETRGEVVERVMDSNDLERERGITILSKNTSILWQDYRINIVDTPGHADFGGEVERVLSMVDSVLLLVDAVEGPMPQTRFVTQKALERGLQPIVVINKIDRPAARPEWVVDQTFDLFDNLRANDEQLDFSIVYASALQGFSTLEPEARKGDMVPLLKTIVERVSAPQVDQTGHFRLQVSALDYSSYTGVIGIGRVQRGRVKANTPITLVTAEGKRRNGRILKIMGFHGLERVEMPEASAGDIITFTGIDGLRISDTLCDPLHVEALPALSVDEPTLCMTFQVNTSPFAGQDGKFVTSRNIRERLDQELLHNVALRVEETEEQDQFRVSGRGELHLSILIENMRREGYELGVSRPEVLLKELEGELCEPYEHLTVDVLKEHQGGVMEKLGLRKGELRDMVPDDKGRVRLDYKIASRGLIGFRAEFMTLTSGEGLIYHAFDHYGAQLKERIGERSNGVLISKEEGKTLSYSLFNLQDRGKLFVDHGDPVYEGMIVGIHSRNNDLVVNPVKGKQLTNMRAAGSDENTLLVPPIRMSLEQSLGFINEDELVEVTPRFIRIRKKYLKEHQRKRNRQ